MPYATMEDLSSLRGQRVAPAYLGDVVGQGDGFAFMVTSDSTYSKAHPSNDPAQPVTIRSALSSGGTVIEFAVPLDRLLVPLDKLLDQSLQPAPNENERKAGIWYGMRYGGAVLLDDYNYIFGAAPVRGSVYMIYNGQDLGRLRYAVISITPAPVVPSSLGGTSIFSSGGYTPPSQLQTMGFEEFEDIFATGWDGRFLGGLHMRLGGISSDVSLPTGAAFNSWYKPVSAYLPDDILDELTKYYDVTEMEDPIAYLALQGYPDPKKELIRRAELRAQFPMSMVLGAWSYWLGAQRSEVDEALSRYAGSGTKNLLKRMMYYEPRERVLAVNRDDFKKMNDRRKDLGIGRSDFKKAIGAAIETVESTENRVFNYSYYRYVAEGMMPDTMIAKSAEQHNIRAEELAKKQAEKDPLAQLIMVAVPFIPIVGLPFALALQVNSAQSNAADIKAAEKRAVEASQATAAEMEKVQDVIAEYNTKENEQAVVQQDKRKKQLVTVGVIASALAAGAAMLMGD